MTNIMRIFFLIAAITIVTACSQERQAAPHKGTDPVASDEITTTLAVTGGKIRGRARENGLKEYLGIPYAAPPIAKLRWQPPQAVLGWNDEYDATKKGLPCIQPSSLSTFYDRTYTEMSEDCLTLNVWTRAERTSEKLPVMVWIHGGALVIGSGADYDGAELTTKGIVLITINYRLGPFGFFAHPELSSESATGRSGNQGFRDQIAALQWVRANVAAFGGDPDNVTIFGESAGSWSMSVMQASPLSRGLFHKVIGQSGARFIPLPKLKTATRRYDSAENHGLRLAELFASDQRTDLTGLRAIPADEIMSVYANDPGLLNNFDTLTIVDGEVLPSEVNTIFANGEQADVPVLVGSNALEASTFDPAMFAPEGTHVSYASVLDLQFKLALPEAGSELKSLYPTATEDESRSSWIDFNTDLMFTQPMNLWAEYMARSDSPVYLYWWDWEPSVNGSQQYGAFHAAEVAYIFGDLAMFDIDSNEREQAFSDTIMTVWTHFAKTGNPSVSNIIDWPAYSLEGQNTATLGAEISLSGGIRRDKMALITAAYNQERAKGDRLRHAHVK